ncbi:unnamed protein product [Heterobilharzia americana]|nr:unnamed protein product [Heterobilharzia americana]
MSTSRFSQINVDNSDSENEILNSNQRTVLFLDQVVAPDRNRLSKAFNNDIEENNYSIYTGGIRSPILSRTISPSSSSSLASYPANYEPSPLIRKKSLDDPGIELVSCTPLPYSTTSQQRENTSKVHKLMKTTARKRLPHLSAFSRQRKNGKKVNLSLSVDEELNGMDKDIINNHNQFDGENVYDELSRLNSNDGHFNGVHDMFDAPDACSSAHKNELNQTAGTIGDRKSLATMETMRTTKTGTLIKTDRHSHDFYQSENAFQQNQIKINQKNYYNTNKNSQHYRGLNLEKTPTGSTETLVGASRQLTLENRSNYKTPTIYREKPYRVISSELSQIGRGHDTYHGRIIDANQPDWRTISSRQSPKCYDNDSTSRHTTNSQTPRIIYVSKRKSVDCESDSELAINRDRIIPISNISEPISTTTFSQHTRKSDQTYVNQYNHVAPTTSSVRRGSIEIIHYNDEDNDL